MFSPLQKLSRTGYIETFYNKDICTCLRYCLETSTILLMMLNAKRCLKKLLSFLSTFGTEWTAHFLAVCGQLQSFQLPEAARTDSVGQLWSVTDATGIRKEYELFITPLVGHIRSRTACRLFLLPFRAVLLSLRWAGSSSPWSCWKRQWTESSINLPFLWNTKAGSGSKI